ncbi:MAG: hypothetical protein HOW73_45815 [Polyangiaceae bacterium]|nr:hypothetical protein [Polyangiaceae bacterium]
MLGFVLGLVSSNAFEWVVHKYVLHGLGRKKGTYWSFHWHEHHKNVRKADGYDAMYELPLMQSTSKIKEAIGVVSGALMATPLIVVSPGFVAAAWISSGAYYYVHKKAHLDPAWGRKYVPWHVDHHLGPDQHANWCVTTPLFDYIMGTRKPFVGTDAELKRPETTTVSA